MKYFKKKGPAEMAIIWFALNILLYILLMILDHLPDLFLIFILVRITLTVSVIMQLLIATGVVEITPDK